MRRREFIEQTLYRQSSGGHIGRIWKKLSWAFEPVQELCNGNYWDMFIRNFGNFENETVLDLGSGTGEILRYIRPRYYTGIDSNYDYINYANRRFSTTRAEFIHADAIVYKPARIYSAAVLSNITHHISDYDLVSVLRKLKSSKIRKVVIADGYPKKPLFRLLSWLDDVLAGGKYFRTSGMLAEVCKNFTAKDVGVFRSDRSLYVYPYIVLEL